MNRIYAILLTLAILTTISTTAVALPEGAVARLGKGRISTGTPSISGSYEGDRPVEFSPDGKLLAVATSIGVDLYDAQTYDEVGFLVTNTQMFSAAFSPDGSLLASGSYSEIQLWDVETKQLIHTFTGHRYGVDSVAFSPDGSLLASGSGEKGGTIQLWDVETKQLVHTSPTFSGSANSIAFSPDGSLLASGSYNEIQLWDIETKQLIHTLRPNGVVHSVAFSPDGSILANGNEYGEVILWDVETKQSIDILTAGAYVAPIRVAFSPDGRTLASGYASIKLWDIETKQLIHTIKGGDIGDIYSVAFSPDGSRLASGNYRDNTVDLWNVKTKQLIHTFKGYTNPVYSVAFSPDSTLLASGSYDEIQLWDIETKQLIHTITKGGDNTYSVAFSPYGSILVSGYYDYGIYSRGWGAVQLWDIETKQLIHKITNVDGVNSVTFSPDGSLLASGSYNEIQLWDVETKQLIHTFTGHRYGVNSVAFSPDGSLLASGSGDDTIKLWDVETKQIIRTLEGHAYSVNSVAFSPDGSLLASGSRDDTIKLWDIEIKQLIHTFTVHTGDVNTVAFSPDGSILVSGSDDGTIKLWDVETKQIIRTLEGHAYSVRSVAFSPDGSILASGSDDGTVILWGDVVPTGDSVPPAAVIDLAIFTLTDNSATLKWTAPGDNGNKGRAKTYDIRYSTSEITDGNWDGAMQCTREPMPKFAGIPEKFTVTGLSPETTYYIAIKTADEVPNWSELSNIAQGTTLRLPPTITSITPSNRGQGATGQNIVIIGTNFMNGADVSFSGNGITVNSTTFGGSAELIANIDIVSDATIGFRNVIVANPDSQTATGKNMFEVTVAPTIISTNPSGLPQSSANYDVIIEGGGFVDNPSNDPNGVLLSADFGDGITVSSVTFLSSTKLIANISIAEDAAVGTRDVTVVNGDAGLGIGVGIFTIESAKDNNAPQIEIITQLSQWERGKIKLEVEVSDEDNKLEKVLYKYSLDGVKWEDIGETRSPPYSIDWDTSDLSCDESVWIRAIAEDATNLKGEYTSESFGIDNEPPNTQHDYDGKWHNPPFTITLTGDDGKCSGIAETRYKLNGSNEQSGTEVVIETEGTHKLEYWSVDEVGNEETHKTISIKIDATPPMSTIALSGKEDNNGWYVSPVEVGISAEDLLSGFEVIRYQLNGDDWLDYSKAFTVDKDGEYTIEFYSIDNVGNKEINQTKSFNIQLPHFTLSVPSQQESQNVRLGGTVTYNLSIVGIYGFEGDIELSSVDLPAGVRASFAPKKVTSTKDTPQNWSELTLAISDSAPIGKHKFTVIAKSRGKYQEIDLSIEILKSLCSTTLSVLLDEEYIDKTTGVIDIEFSQPVKIVGKLTLGCDASESFEIKLTFESPSGNKADRFADTKAENQQYSATFDDIGELGTWRVKASFEKEGYQQANETAEFTVIKGTSMLEWLSPPEPTSIDRSRTLRGKLYPNLEGKSINLRQKRPDSSFVQIATVKTDSDGIFEHEVAFDEVGDWEYKATWSGDNYYQGCGSEIYKTTVRKESGVFLLVLGGGDEINNENWNTYNELANYVYNSIIKCNFSDDEIYFLSPSKYPSDRVDTKTTRQNLEQAITVWAKERVGKNIPFYLYLLSHNTEAQFLLEKYADKQVYITPDDVKEWIDKLPKETQSTIIIEACYSGQFIPTLANGDRKRVIIASSRGDQKSTLEEGLHSFSKYFFDDISHPHDLKNAVQKSQQFVYQGFNKTQYPVFDADGDGIPANPDDTYEYGLLTDRYIYVEKGISLANKPDIHDVEVPQHLPLPNSGVSIKVKLIEPTESTVKVIVIPPHFEPSPISPVVKFDTINLTHVGNQVYKSKYEGFNKIGEYTILIEATNIDGVSEPDLVTVTVGYDLNGDGVVDIQDLVLLGKHFGESGRDVRGDVNCDGIVDIQDMVIMGNRFGER